MQNLVKRVAVSALASSILWLSVPAANAGKLLHFEKPPALRQKQAEHRAKVAQKKMAAKKHHLSHGQ